MTNSESDIEELKILLNRYLKSIFSLVKDLKKRNSPLGVQYHVKPILRWDSYKSWYRADTNPNPIPNRDWTMFIYNLHSHLKNADPALHLSNKVQTISKNENVNLFEDWLLKSLFIFFDESEERFYNRTKLVNHLIHAVKNEPPIVQTKSLISGIMLESDEIIIDSTLKIRKATRPDLEFSLELGYDRFDFEHAIEQSFCVVEYSYKKTSEHVMSIDMLQKVTMILKLFKLSSAECTTIAEKPSGVELLDFYGTRQSGFYPKRGVVCYAKLKQNDEDYVKKFYKLMQKRLPHQMLNYYLEQNEIEIALSRFFKGIDRIHHVTSSVAYAVMAVEALLLKSEGDQKLRFAQKSSLLLSFVGLKRKQVYENMIKAYDIRSKYVHGDQMSAQISKHIKQKFPSDESFIFTIMDYTRLIIVIYLILDKSKDNFYKLIENALFDNNKQLQKTMSSLSKYMDTKNYRPKFRIRATRKAKYIIE